VAHQRVDFGKTVPGGLLRTQQAIRRNLEVFVHGFFRGLCKVCPSFRWPRATLPAADAADPRRPASLGSQKTLRATANALPCVFFSRSEGAHFRGDAERAFGRSLRKRPIRSYRRLSQFRPLFRPRCPEPSGSNLRGPKTCVVVNRTSGKCAPPEFSATLPPMLQRDCDEDPCA